MNTQLSVDGNPDAKFKTRNSVTLVVGLNAIQEVAFGSIPDAGSFTLIHRTQETVVIPFGAVALDVQNALNGLPHLSGVVVTGDFTAGFTIEFDGDDGLQAQTVTVGANSLTDSAVPVAVTPAPNQIGLPQALVELEAVEAGPVDAPIGTLTVIDTPVSGLNRTINVEATVIGRNRENDVQLKSRREETLAVGGNAALSRRSGPRSKIWKVSPMRSYSKTTRSCPTSMADPENHMSAWSMVVEMAALADVIWKSKPGGIRTFGQITENVVDSQGVTRVIQFSRPTQVRIYTSLDLTVDVATFPINGALKAKELIVAWGAGLGIGKDVIVYPQLVAQLAEVPGILDIRVRIDTSPVSNTPNDPAVDDNIDIQPFEVASFAEGDTVVNVL